MYCELKPSSYYERLVLFKVPDADADEDEVSDHRSQFNVDEVPNHSRVVQWALA